MRCAAVSPISRNRPSPKSRMRKHRPHWAENLGALPGGVRRNRLFFFRSDRKITQNLQFLADVYLGGHDATHPGGLNGLVYTDLARVAEHLGRIVLRSNVRH